MKSNHYYVNLKLMGLIDILINSPSVEKINHVRNDLKNTRKVMSRICRMTKSSAKTHQRLYELNRTTVECLSMAMQYHDQAKGVYRLIQALLNIIECKGVSCCLGELQEMKKSKQTLIGAYV